jgi:hypothetical protein
MYKIFTFLLFLTITTSCSAQTVSQIKITNITSTSVTIVFTPGNDYLGGFYEAGATYSRINNPGNGADDSCLDPSACIEQKIFITKPNNTSEVNKQISGLQPNSFYQVKLFLDSRAIDGPLKILPEIITFKTLDINSPKDLITEKIKLKSRGAQVLTLEKFLNKKGFLAQDYVDNFFGIATLKAVKEFQKLNNLTPDGSIGPKTASVINNQI